MSLDAAAGRAPKGPDRAVLRRLGPFISLALFGLAVWVLQRELRAHSLAEVAACLRALPPRRLLLSVAASALGYLTLTGYDALGVRYLGHRLPYRKVARASFISYALSHNLGLSLLSGSSARLRLYSALGLSATDIAKVIAFCAATLWMGIFCVGGLALLLQPPEVLGALRFSPAVLRPLGVLFLAVVAAYVVAALRRRQALSVAGWRLELPSPGICLGQLACACLDWVLAAAALYVVLPPEAGFGFAGFLGIYFLAQVAGLFSQVPGGLGVFETTVLLLAPGVPAPALLASLLIFRASYYLLPLAVAALLLALHEFRRSRQELRRPR